MVPMRSSLSLQYGRTKNAGAGINGHLRAGAVGGKTVGRWLKDRKEKKKEETRAHNAQLHAAVSVAAVAAAVAAIAAATAASSGSDKDEQMAKTDTAVASAATLVAAQCVEAAEAMGADREHLASVVGSAVNVRSAGDIMTLTAAAATGMCVMVRCLMINFSMNILFLNGFEFWWWKILCYNIFDVACVFLWRGIELQLCVGLPH